MTQCKHDEFECRDTSDQCLSRYVMCDGVNDCDNGRDEDIDICKCNEHQVSCSHSRPCPHQTG